MKGPNYRVDTSVAHLYKITNKNTGEYYIGKHCGYDQRKSGGGFYWGSGERIRNAIKKHGKENFSYEVLVIGSVDYIIDLEAKYVTKELIEEDSLCMNLMTGGISRRSYSKESVEKATKNRSKPVFSEKGKKALSEFHTGNKYALGYKHTDETKEKLKEIRAKQVFTKEQREKANKTISSLIWMNDGIRSYRVRPENIQASKEKGLVEGRLLSFVTDKYREKVRMNSLKQWQKHKEASTGPLKGV
jgi:hypothetical protein